MTHYCHWSVFHLLFCIAVLSMDSVITKCLSQVTSEAKLPQQSWEENISGDQGPENSLFPGYVYRTVLGQNIYQCVLSCHKDDRCKSFNHYSSQNICEINSNDRITQQSQQADSSILEWYEVDGLWVTAVNGLVPTTGAKYYSRNAFRYLKEFKNEPCASSPCKQEDLCSPSFNNSFKTALCQRYIFSPQIYKSYYMPSDWGSWGECSEVCGGGSQVRTRSWPAKFSWMVGEVTNKRLCNQHVCPIWAEWNAWSKCESVKNCGSGKQNRTRSCLLESPLRNLTCTGSSNDETDCRQNSCDAPVGLSYKTQGFVYLYDDSDPFNPKWRPVCLGNNITSFENERLEAHAQLVVCKQIGMYVDDPTTAINKRYQQNSFSFKSCNLNTNYLMECEPAPLEPNTACSQLHAVCSDVKIRHYVKPPTEITWNLVQDYCEIKGRKMCSFSEIFPNAPVNYDVVITGIISGNHWVPIRDQYNEWALVGNWYHRTGWIFSKHFGRQPTWGEYPTYNSRKSNYFCCG